MNPVPLRFGSEAEFAALRAALEGSGFTESGLCERLGLERVSQYRLDGARHLEQPPEDSAGLLIWLLLEGGAVPRAAGGKIPLRELETLGVVTPHPSNQDEAVATVMLYPMHGLYVVSDRPRPVEGKLVEQAPDDFVYPAIVPNTDLFLNLLPSTPCDACLDLCSGTGIAALKAARSGARHAWALDVTERSTQFAEFNRRLNAISNVTAAQGDLYEPADALTFDRIVAHPPYVPVYRPQLIFDSGGQDGEQIVRRIIEGLPRYLRPGGRFYALTLGTDRDRPFERRLRDWLGQAEAEFDVAFTVRQQLTPREYASEAVIRNRGRVDDIHAWRELFERQGIEGLSYGFLTIQRRDRPREVFTVRRQTGSRTGPAEHAWMMDWETSVALGSAGELLRARPRASYATSLQVEQRLTPTGWEAQGYRLEIDYPFRMEVGAQAWTAHLLAMADGSLTGAELLEKLKSAGALHPDAPPSEYAQILAVLVSGGFLEI
jgi:methylase of polypeptide subunit release factors